MLKKVCKSKKRLPVFLDPTLRREIEIIRGKQNPFCTNSINDAKKVILTDWYSFSSDYRWQFEAGLQLLELRKFIRENSVICDFGIGIGRISKEILKKFRSVYIIGIDSSKTMLNQCRQNIPSAYHNRLKLVPFDRIKAVKTKSIDFAFAIYVFQHIPANLFKVALKELKRIIKPEGFLYLFNNNVRYVVDGALREQWYDDKLPQLDIISKYFEEVQDVKYGSEYIKEILKTHFSKLFRPK